MFIDTVAIGLTVFELSEDVEVRYIGGEEQYARIGSTAERTAPRRPHDWTTKQWLVSGRLGVHAYAPYGSIRWERYWREKKPGELPTLFAVVDAIGKELESQAPAIVTLLEQAKRDAEERQRNWEIERREMEKREAERRRVEREAQREKEIVDTLSKWRLARDLRAYVAEIKAHVHNAGLEITKESSAEEALTWATAYADRIDPLSSWRQDIENVKAQLASEPCPKCSEIHGVDDGMEPTDADAADIATDLGGSQQIEKPNEG